MMNKKILLSVVAAATIGSVFTGCGSSSSSSDDGTTISGIAQKDNIYGALVTVGDETTTTGAKDAADEGEFSVLKGADETLISITGGKYLDSNDEEVTNTVEFKASLSQPAGDIKVNTLTTMVELFRAEYSNLSETALQLRACNLLGITLTAGQDIYDVEADTMEIAALNIVQYLKEVQESTNGLKAFITSLYDSSESLVYLATLRGNLVAAFASAKSADSSITAEVVAYVDESVLFTNVVNLEGNSTSATDAAIEYTIDGGENWTGVTRTDSSLNANSSVVLTGATKIQFELTDHTTSLETLGKGSLFIKYDGADESNSNSSYRMALTGLDLATHTEGDDTYITLNHNASAKLTTTAYSTTNIAMSNVNVSADTLCNSGLIAQGNGNESIVVNLSSFVGYMADTYEPYSDVANGNFTSGMLNGNYSLRVYVNIDDQDMSRDERSEKIISATTYVGQDGLDGVDTTDATSYTGYKMLDTNLNY